MSNPARYLLDTSVLLAHYREESGSETVQGLFEDPEFEILIAAPTLTEFARRLRELGAADAEIIDAIDKYSLLFDEIVATDASIATAAYVIGRQSPGRIPLIDALIAASAQARDAILVHRDAHMASIPTEIVRQQSLILP